MRGCQLVDRMTVMKKLTLVKGHIHGDARAYSMTGIGLGAGDLRFTLFFITVNRRQM